MDITVHTDGAARGNPGPAAIAYIIEGLAPEPLKFARKIGKTTNNQAEYQDLIAALEKLVGAGIGDVSIDCFSDSELIVRQLSGQYKVKNRALRPLFEQASSCLDHLRRSGNKITLNCIERMRNREADRLANLVLDGKLDV